jgi:formate C-acetyltransferase
MVIDSGFDTVTGKQLSLKTKDVSEISSFEEFYSLYLEHLQHLYLNYIGALRPHEAQIQTINPSLMFSTTIDKCVRTMTDALSGGITCETATLVCGIGTATDALMAVYELVFERKVTTLGELRDALANNWEGYERLRLEALACKHKYGNNDKMADSYAAAILRAISNIQSGRKNIRGGCTNLEIHSARAFIIHGELTAATPDGRRAGEEISKNASPTPGADRNGVTALIKSATALDHSLANNGSCLDVMLHPSAVSGDDGIGVLEGVLATYIKLGGGSIHFNIFDADTLRDAQKNPEKYQNLQVRVCGWNVLWNNMSKIEQDAYILRAENIT